MQIGDKIVITLTKQLNGKEGTIKYKGPLQGKEGEWYGIQLDTPEGNHNGSFAGKRIFQGKEQHCVFMQQSNIRAIQKKMLVSASTAKMKKQEEKKDDREKKDDKQKKDEKKDQKKDDKQKKDIKKGDKKETKTGPSLKKDGKEAKQEKKELDDKARRMTMIKKSEEKKEETILRADHQDRLREKDSVIEQLTEARDSLRLRVQALESGQNEKLRAQIEALQKNLKEARKELEWQQVNKGKDFQEEKGILLRQIAMHKNAKEAAEKDLKKAQDRVGELEEECAALKEQESGGDMVDQLVMKNEQLQVVVEEQKLQIEELQQKLSGLLESKEQEQKRIESAMGGEATADPLSLLQDLKARNEYYRAESETLKRKNQFLQQNVLELRSKDEEARKLAQLVQKKSQELEEMAERVDQAQQSVTLVEQMADQLLRKDEQIRSLREELKAKLLEKGQFEQLLNDCEEIIEGNNKDIAERDSALESERSKYQELKEQLQMATEQNNNYKQRVAALSKQLREVRSQPAEGRGQAEVENAQPKVASYSFEMAKQLNQLRLREVESKLKSTEFEETMGVVGLNLFSCFSQEMLEELRAADLQLVADLRTLARNSAMLTANIVRALVFDPIYSQESNQSLGDKLIKSANLLSKGTVLSTRLVLAVKQADSAELLVSLVQDKQFKQLVGQYRVCCENFAILFAKGDLSPDFNTDPLEQAPPHFEQHGLELRTDLQAQWQLGRELSGYLLKLADMVFMFRQVNEAAGEIDPTIGLFVEKGLCYLGQLVEDPNIRMIQETRYCLEAFALLNQLHGMVQKSYLDKLDSLYSVNEEVTNLYLATLNDAVKFIKLLQQDIQEQAFKTPLEQRRFKLNGQLWAQRFTAARDRLDSIKKTEDKLTNSEAQLKKKEGEIVVLQKRVSDMNNTQKSFEGRIVQLQLKAEKLVFVEEETKLLRKNFQEVSDNSQRLKQQLIKQRQRVKSLEKVQPAQADSVASAPVEKAKPVASEATLLSDPSLKVLLGQLTQLKSRQTKRRVDRLLQAALPRVRGGPKDVFSREKESLRLMKELLRVPVLDPGRYQRLSPQQQLGERKKLLGVQLARLFQQQPEKKHFVKIGTLTVES